MRDPASPGLTMENVLGDEGRNRYRIRELWVMKRRRRDGEKKRNEKEMMTEETRTWRAKRNEAGDDFLDES